ncbi:MAG: hypothetical protein EAX96_05330 [Candidatus Lokiarchaeota archaeon]|nr:hypothetical protein [Candidatus Lokiarchaeota archaeon]
MSEIPTEAADKLTDLLKKLEARTELEACAVITREGLRIACAVNSEVDADVYSAASAALVNLGETTLKQLRHGGLKEIIVRGDDGYTILTQAGALHMVVGSCKKLSRMGYYLALLHRFSNKVAKTLGTEVLEEYPTPIPQPEIELVEQPDLTPLEPPTTISYQPEYEQPQEYSEPMSYEAAPQQEEVGFDKSALFDALQHLGASEETPRQPSQVNESSLMEALKPKEAAPRPTYTPFQQGPTPAPSQFVPVAGHDDDEDVFKISDKDAVLEALKVLGWEEPEE